MIRIGFDPLLEAERQHQELIKEVQLYRLAKEGLVQPDRNTRSSARLLALIGKRMASLGVALERRYGVDREEQATLVAQENPSGCS